MREESEGEGEGEGGERGVISEVINIPQTANDAQPRLAAARSPAASRAPIAAARAWDAATPDRAGMGTSGLAPHAPLRARLANFIRDTHTHTGTQAHAHSARGGELVADPNSAPGMPFNASIFISFFLFLFE